MLIGGAMEISRLSRRMCLRLWRQKSGFVQHPRLGLHNFRETEFDGVAHAGTAHSLEHQKLDERKEIRVGFRASRQLLHELGPRCLNGAEKIFEAVVISSAAREWLRIVELFKSDRFRDRV